MFPYIIIERQVFENRIKTLGYTKINDFIKYELPNYIITKMKKGTSYMKIPKYLLYYKYDNIVNGVIFVTTIKAFTYKDYKKDLRISLPLSDIHKICEVEQYDLSDDFLGDILTIKTKFSEYKYVKKSLRIKMDFDKLYEYFIKNNIKLK